MLSAAKKWYKIKEWIMKTIYHYYLDSNNKIEKAIITEYEIKKGSSIDYFIFKYNNKKRWIRNDNFDRVVNYQLTSFTEYTIEEIKNIFIEHFTNRCKEKEKELNKYRNMIQSLLTSDTTIIK